MRGKGGRELSIIFELLGLKRYYKSSQAAVTFANVCEKFTCMKSQFSFYSFYNPEINELEELRVYVPFEQN